jgi:GNAT superfamily N-acetyltransferase
MVVMEYRYAIAGDASAMAELFAANRDDALTEQQRAEQGFVQGGLDAAAFRAMAGTRGVLVADDGGRIAGLLGLVSASDLPAASPPVQALLDAQDELRWRGSPLSRTRWLLYGPVVVDADYRGQGVARGLFTAAVESAAGQADTLVAFIELTNKLSWRVHVDGFGMQPLGEVTAANGRAYAVVAAAVDAGS